MLCQSHSRAASVATAKPEAATQSNSITTFYLNRDCDVARRESISSFIENAGLAAERIAGINGYDVPAHLRGYFFDGETLHSKLKAGEVGCYASHLVAMERVVERNLSHALILEDDAIVPVDTAKILQEVLRTVPSGWDLIHLCKDSNRAVKIIANIEGGRRIVRYSRVPETTTGYLVSQSGARKFLKPSKRYWPIDTDFRQPWQFGLEIYGVTPCIIRPEDYFESSIHMLGNHSRLRRGFPIPSRHCWTGNPLHTPSGVLFNLRKLGPAAWAMCATRNARNRLTRMLGLHQRGFGTNSATLAGSQT